MNFSTITPTALNRHWNAKALAFGFCREAWHSSTTSWRMAPDARTRALVVARAAQPLALATAELGVAVVDRLIAPPIQMGGVALGGVVALVRESVQQLRGRPTHGLAWAAQCGAALGATRARAVASTALRVILVLCAATAAVLGLPAYLLGWLLAAPVPLSRPPCATEVLPMTARDAARWIEGLEGQGGPIRSFENVRYHQNEATGSCTFEGDINLIFGLVHSARFSGHILSTEGLVHDMAFTAAAANGPAHLEMHFFPSLYQGRLLMTGTADGLPDADSLSEAQNLHALGFFSTQDRQVAADAVHHPMWLRRPPQGFTSGCRFVAYERLRPSLSHVTQQLGFVHCSDPKSPYGHVSLQNVPFSVAAKFGTGMTLDV